MKCLCGCGEKVKVGRKFISGHNSRVKDYNKCDNNKGKITPKETREKLSIATKKAFLDPIVKERHKEAVREFTSKKEYREKLSIILKEVTNTPEHKIKVSENSKKMWQQEGFKEKASKKMKEVWSNSDYKEKMKQKQNEKWKDPHLRKKHKEAMNREDVKEKISKASKRNMSNPEIKKKMINTMKKKFSDPDFRKMISERTKEGMKEKGYTPEVISKLTKEGMKGLDLSGPNSASWKGGISNSGYCSSWNDQEVKEYILERDNYKCQNPDCWKTSTRIARHHIDYDKKNCSVENIITICISCNGRANKDREYWKKLYSKILKEKYNELE